MHDHAAAHPLAEAERGMLRGDSEAAIGPNAWVAGPEMGFRAMDEGWRAGELGLLNVPGAGGVREFSQVVGGIEFHALTRHTSR